MQFGELINSQKGYPKLVLKDLFTLLGSFCNQLLILQTIHFCLDTILRNALSKQWVAFSTDSVFILMVAFSLGSLLNMILARYGNFSLSLF